MNADQAAKANAKMESLPVLPYEFIPHGLVKTSEGERFAILMVTPWTQDTVLCSRENLQKLKAICTEGQAVLKPEKKLEVVTKPGLELA